MKKILLVLALFPFLHATSYTAEAVSCKQDEIIVKAQGENIKISLFNIKLKDEQAWNKACDDIKSAKRISFQIDPGSAVKEPVPVYLFLDENLLQETLLKDDLAFIQIRNPEYLYEKQMEEALSTQQAMAAADDQADNNHGSARNAPLFLLVLCCIWGIMGFLFCKKRHIKK